ncbi:MAG: DUF4173 domain-containing protein [Syntrophomonas sp.]
MNEHSTNLDGSASAGESAAFPIMVAPARTRNSLKEPFSADRTDGLFALFAFVLGFYFARWVLFSWEGWGVTAFTLVYCASLSIYLVKKGVQIPKASWFWLALTALTGISFSLWTDIGLEPWRSLLLLGSAVYWVVCATGLLILGQTSNWIGLDTVNGFLVIPFSNFVSQYKSLSFLSRNKKTRTSQFLSIALGLIITLIVIAIVFPLLLKADGGGFARLTGGILTYFKEIKPGEYVIHAILAVPIAAYIFGLAAGSAHKRGCDAFKEESTRQAFSVLRILPAATVYTLLGLLCSLYVLFIASQLPYFFSAFAGQRPEGWQVYSEYARSGFFELCRIAAINLSVLLIANLFGKNTSTIKGSEASPDAAGSETNRLHGGKILKILNSLLAILTLLLIATAMSKMFLYIGVYGLSMRRLLPCLFMAFLAVICGGVVALQKWDFSMARLGAVVGSVMLCALCLVDPDGFVTRYNADRYLAGTLSDFDVEILRRSGPAGVDSALKVYTKTGDQALQAELKEYLLTQQQLAGKFAGQHRDNLQKTQARQNIAKYF